MIEHVLHFPHLRISLKINGSVQLMGIYFALTEHTAICILECILLDGKKFSIPVIFSIDGI